jgi:hypothetical protein
MTYLTARLASVVAKATGGLAAIIAIAARAAADAGNSTSSSQPVQDALSANACTYGAIALAILAPIFTYAAFRGGKGDMGNADY